jgi:hypothetical protein
MIYVDVKGPSGSKDAHLAAGQTLVAQEQVSAAVSPPPPMETSVTGKAWQAARSSGYAALALVSLVTAYAGIVYWIAQGWAWGVLLSLTVPGFGLASVIWDLSA